MGLEEELAAAEEARRRGGTQPDLKGRKISEVGDQTAAGLACPKCGGTAFKAKRSMGAKAAAAPLLIAAVALPKTRVKCVTCGTTYKRG